MTRKDIHRPSAIVPEDYDFVGYEVVKIEGMGDVAIALREREIIKVHMAKTGGTYSRHAHGGNCMICGNANAMYTALFYHEKTNSYVRVGSTCVETLGMGIESGINEFAARFRDAMAAKAGKRKAELLIAEAGLFEAWTIYSAPIPESDSRFVADKKSIVRDIVSKLVEFGNLSEKQWNFLKSLVVQIADAPAIEAARKAEAEAAAPAPKGRVEFTGEVVTVKSQPGYVRGSETLKMLVKAVEGFKVWVTVPDVAMSAIDGQIRGHTVTVRATLEPSKDDPKFAFGKRPTLLAVDGRKLADIFAGAAVFAAPCAFSAVTV